MSSELRLQRLEPLFFSPLAVFEVADAAALNARLVAEALARRASSPGLQRSNRRGWHSEDDLFSRDEPGAQALCDHIVDAVSHLTEQVSPHFDLDGHDLQLEGWINVLADGGLNAPHDHPGWVWSGCYYAQVPDDVSGPASAGEGAIEFLDSRTNVRTLTVDGAACFASKYRVQPRAGQLLIFPSWLRHWVEPHHAADALRVSIAFNARFLRRDLA
jgi:uncharacterized protein (TIGR02466 family)